jgi:hypothetical protein
MELLFVEEKIKHALTHFNDDKFADNSIIDLLCLVSLIPKETENILVRSTKAEVFKNYLLRKITALQVENELYGKILHTRYVKGETVRGTNYKLKLDTSVAHFQNNLQPTALRQLAQLILDDHNENVKQRQSKLEHLPVRDYDKLFGIDDTLKKLKSILRDENSSWVTIVTGIGGIGKTALVRECVNQIVEKTCYFDGVIWATAQRSRFMGRRKLDSDLDLTLEKLLDTIVKQLGFPEKANHALATKQREIHAMLKSARYLMVFDNLETIEEIQDIKPIIETLYEMSNPSKVLLTSRVGMDTTLPIVTIPLSYLDEQDAIQFAEYYAQTRAGIPLPSSPDLRKKLQDVTKGNPLAIILVVSQLRDNDLDSILDNLLNSIGSRHDEYYNFVFEGIWQRLSSQAQSLLAWLASSPTIKGVTTSILQKLSGYNDTEFTDALASLVRSSLINISYPNENEYIYSLHPLTRRFVLLKLQLELQDKD